MSVRQIPLGLTVIVVLLSLVAGAPARAQGAAQLVFLPVVSRQLALQAGMVLSVTSSRLAPELKAAVVARSDGATLNYDLLISRDQGLTWMPPASEPWDSQAADPNALDQMRQPRVVLVNGGVALVTIADWFLPPTLFVSQDFGQTWAPRTLALPLTCTEIVPEQLMQSPARPDRVLFAGRCLNQANQSDPFLVASADAGQTWTLRDPWAPGKPAWYAGLVNAATDADLLFRRLPMNWQRSDDLGATWENHSVPGDRLVISPNTPDVQAAIGPALGLGLSSLDRGRTWRAWGNLPCGLSDIIGPAWLRGSDETLLAVCSSGAVIRSRDAGQTWETLSMPALEGLTFVAADDSVADTVFVQTWTSTGSVRYRVHRSRDGGDTWQDVLVLTGP